MVLPTAAVEASGEKMTLRSAQIRYETIEPSGNSDDVANHRLLAIRYPHPNGRLDVARAEIVIADAARNNEEPSGKAGNRLTQFLAELSPGVSWSTGIKQAKAHDLKLTELRELIAESSSWSNDRIVPAVASLAAGEDIVDATSDGQATLWIEVDGETTELVNKRSSRLDAIAAQVLARGKLISVNQQPAELFQLNNSSESTTPTSIAPSSQLVPLPVVPEDNS